MHASVSQLVAALGSEDTTSLVVTAPFDALCRSLPDLQRDTRLAQQVREKLSVAVVDAVADPFAVGLVAGFVRVLKATLEDHEDPVVLAELQNRASREIVEQLERADNGMTTGAVAAALLKDAGGISRVLSRMQTAGAVLSRQEGRHKRWWLTEAARVAWETRKEVRDGDW